MIWSFSTHWVFKQCQRQWFFKSKMANPRASDPLRKEAFILSQLSSMPAWRGRLVDIVIEQTLIPYIKNNRIPSLETLVKSSNELIECQLNFGNNKKYRSEGVTKSSAGHCYVAFYDIEYNGSLSDDKVNQVRNEVEVALENLIKNQKILKLLKESIWIKNQVSLMFKHHEYNIRGTLDILSFRKDKPPVIIDWKTQQNPTKDYWLQLGLYGIALTRANPSQYWPSFILENGININEIELYEVQLLTNQVRPYTVDDSDIAEIENIIEESCLQITLLEKGKKYDQLDINQFLRAKKPYACTICNFKKLCWDGELT